MPPDPVAGLMALNRFGFGARGDGDLAEAARDPRGVLLRDLDAPGAGALEAPGLMASQPALALYFEDQEARRLERESMAAQAAKAAMATQPPPGAPPAPPFQAPPPATSAPAKPAPSVGQSAYRAETLARAQRAIEAQPGFVERLVCFWSNHFCVSIAKAGPLPMLVGPFERETIRPHVLGRFADMLKAVERHQAMIFYLDNQLSIGPNSPAGRNRGKGLNENLAREIMELHTLGVDGGYTQADVAALARILTGWSYVGREGRAGTPGAQLFAQNYHEPGAQSLLGATFPAGGREQGLAALDELARRPETARHIGAKFAQHFVADHPPAALVAKFARVFSETQGDLRALALALIEAPESWAAPMAKLRSPFEFLAAGLRATGVAPAQPQQLIGMLGALGQPLWGPPGPNGYPDTLSAWATPEGMKARLDIAARLAQRSDAPDPVAMLDRVLGEAASTETRQAVARAATRQQGVALLLMSPELQRR